MGYYVKGFEQKTLKLTVVKTSDPLIENGKTRIEAIVNTIDYCYKTLEQYKKDPSEHGRLMVKRQKLAIKLLSNLLKK